MKLKALLVAVAALSLMGCDEMDGQLTVVKDFKVKVKNKEQTISAGVYKTQLDFKKDRIQAEIENASGKTKVDFKVPEGSTLPENGNFELRSAQTDQPVDVTGDVKTVRTESQVQSGWESCQYTDHQTICTPQGCFTQPVNRWGQQYTEFYYRNTDKNVNFVISNVGMKNILAKFAGASRISQKVIIRQNRCM